MCFEGSPSNAKQLVTWEEVMIDHMLEELNDVTLDKKKKKKKKKKIKNKKWSQYLFSPNHTGQAIQVSRYPAILAQGKLACLDPQHTILGNRVEVYFDLFWLD